MIKKQYNNKNKEDKMNKGKISLKACLARIFLIPASAGFLALFIINFVLAVSALALLSAGLLCLPVGLVYMTGAVKILKVVSDLSPVTLTAAGALMLCGGVFLGFFLCVFSPFSVRLLYKYTAVVKDKRWRRLYSNFSFSKMLKVSLAVTMTFLAVFIGLRCLDISRGYESTVVKESLSFPAASYLYISTSGLDFEIKSYDGEEIRVEYTNDMPIIVEESSEDYLKITQDDYFTLSLFAKDQFGYKMTVWLPESNYREFYLSSGSGAITLEGTQSLYTKLRTRSGNIYINGADKEVNAASISGEISCSYNEFTAEGIFESREGNIRLLLPEKSGADLKFRTDSGWLDSGLMGLEERFFGSIDIQKPSNHPDMPLNILYVTTVSSGLILETAD